MLVTPGSTAVVESPCYQGAAYVLESLGAKLHPVPIDRDGLDVSQLPHVKNALAYVTPSHQYPVGVTMSLQRRIELLSWATQYDAYIMEDDYDSDFRFVGSPLTALKGLDRNERVIYLGTFSKCMGPGLRLGYIVAPRRLVDSFRRMKMLMNNGQSWLEQAAMADFMASGEFGRHLRRIRQLYRDRRDALLGALKKHFGECEIYGEQAGMHLVWKLPEGFPSAAEVEAKGLAAGVGVCSLATGSALRFGDVRRRSPADAGLRRAHREGNRGRHRAVGDSAEGVARARTLSHRERVVAKQPGEGFCATLQLGVVAPEFAKCVAPSPPTLRTDPLPQGEGVASKTPSPWGSVAAEQPLTRSPPATTLSLSGQGLARVLFEAS